MFSPLWYCIVANYKPQTLIITNLHHRLQTDAQTTNKALHFLHNTESKQTDLLMQVCSQSNNDNDQRHFFFGLQWVTGRKEGKWSKKLSEGKERDNRDRDDVKKGNTQCKVRFCVPLCQQLSWLQALWPSHFYVCNTLMAFLQKWHKHPLPLRVVKGHRHCDAAKHVFVLRFMEVHQRFLCLDDIELNEEALSLSLHLISECGCVRSVRYTTTRQ